MARPSYIVYRITCSASGKSYIGITIRSLRERWKQHVAQAKAAAKPSPIQAAIRKHGRSSFSIEAIASAASLPDLYETERVLIRQEGTRLPLGYNATDGGDRPSGYRPPKGVPSGRALDLANQRFGRLTATRIFGRAGKKVLWACTCECGGEAIVSTSNLRTGNTTSCGCAHKEASRAAKLGSRAPTFKDIAGHRFGRLRVLGPSSDWQPKTAKWRVVCDCGAEKEVRGGDLRAGAVVSCGCHSVDRFSAWARRPERSRRWRVVA